MYKELMGVVFIIGVLAWIYVTLKINGIFDMNEGFAVDNSDEKKKVQPSDGISKLADMQDFGTEVGSNYLTKLQDNLKLLGKQSSGSGAKTCSHNNGLKPVLDSLREFVTEKVSKSPEGRAMLQNLPKGIMEGYKDILGQDNIASNAEDITSTTDETKKTPPKVNKPVSTEGPKCKFISSYSERATCPDKYPSHLGASFGAQVSSGLRCNGTSVAADPAKAYAIVRNGRISKIKLVHGGSNYVNPPRVKIIGKGSGARARASVGSDGTVQSIKVLHPGNGYTSSPKIILGKPDGYLYCHLCCSIPQG